LTEEFRMTSRLVLPRLIAWAIAPVLLVATILPARAESVEELLAAVVKVKTFVPSDSRTAGTLGREREGSGIVIDSAGLILTIGYLMVEAQGAEITGSDGRAVPAQVIGYDHESGFGLLRANPPPRVKPLALGRSADLKERDPVLIASQGGPDMAGPAFVVSRRVFAGSWEYMLDDAIFTAPPHPAWSGAALIDQGGKLVGVGSLIVGDTTGTNTHLPGNMFVPIDRLKPILADLIADGRVSGPSKPWLGLNTEELRGRLFVTRVSPDSPAARAGIQPGDVVVSVGGETPRDLPDFYRKVWARGPAGVEVPLGILQGTSAREVTLQSVDRRQHLRLGRTY
jgi:S1-C subfamily serine protease